MIESPIKNAYADEQEKLENNFQIELELTLKIGDLLDLYNYDIDAILVEGRPEVKLVKRV